MVLGRGGGMEAGISKNYDSCMSIVEVLIYGSLIWWGVLFDYGGLDICIAL